MKLDIKIDKTTSKTIIWTVIITSIFMVVFGYFINEKSLVTIEVYENCSLKESTSYYPFYDEIHKTNDFGAHGHYVCIIQPPFDSYVATHVTKEICDEKDGDWVIEGGDEYTTWLMKVLSEEDKLILERHIN